jgi:hypothetical protein
LSSAVALRLLAAVAAGLLLVATALTISWQRTAGAMLPAEVAAPGADAEPDPEGTPEPDPDEGATEELAQDQPTLPHDPEEAETIGAEELLAAGTESAEGAWADLLHPSYDVVERPVHVVSVHLDEDRRGVTVDATVAFRADADTDEIRLRLLPAAPGLDGGLEVEVRRDGEPTEHEVDGDAAILVVPLDPPLGSGNATVLRFDLRYDLVDTDDISGEAAGPAGYGLLARSAEASVLSHWLPLLVPPEDAGPLVPWADVSAFPAAVWSVLIDAPGDVVTGGAEAGCPEDVTVVLGCTWSRGVALREVAMVAYDLAHNVTGGVGEVRLRASAAPPTSIRNPDVLDIVRRSTELFTDRFGPLAWPTLDVAAVRLGGDAAGMEFSGLILLDLDMYDRLDGGFGEYVTAHEVAHQWFHGLVGNGSLSAPVVDEPLAQYLAYLYWEDRYGSESAERLADSAIRGPYAEAQATGAIHGPPARPAAEFRDGREYFALIYGRAALGWLAAEEEAGRPTVEALIRALVDEHALDDIDGDTIIAMAEQEAPAVADVLRSWWLAEGELD